MPEVIASNLENLLTEIRRCRLCEGLIPEPRPVFRARVSTNILLVGQAPGAKVHLSGIPWNDASGNRLRRWMDVDEDTFYDESRIAIIPMGFCYPGKGRSGDLPPRPECASTWHARLRAQLPNIRCTLLIGRYAQAHYLSDDYNTLTERVRHWRALSPAVFVLPHPSPRNQLWLRKNPWFESETVPSLQEAIRELL